MSTSLLNGREQNGGEMSDAFGGGKGVRGECLIKVMDGAKLCMVMVGWGVGREAVSRAL